MPLAPQVQAFLEAQAAAGVESKLSCYSGQVHIFFQLGALFDGGRQAVEESCSALRKAYLQ